MSDPIRGRSLRLGTLILFAALASPSWSSDPFQIDSAYWNAEYSRLSVRGKGDDGRNVVVANAGASGTVIGEDRIDHEDWRVRVYELASVPCRVRATQSNGEVDERNVSNRPADCDDGNNGGNGGGQPPNPPDPRNPSAGNNRGSAPSGGGNSGGAPPPAPPPPPPGPGPRPSGGRTAPGTGTWPRRRRIPGSGPGVPGAWA